MANPELSGRNSLESPQVELARNQCGFCIVPETKGTELFHDMYGIDQVLNIPQIPASYTAMQDIVPIAEEGAHILLIPNRVGKEHYISLALENNQNDLIRARTTVTEQLQRTFPDNPIFTFEHGAGFVGDEPVACGGCHMDHAHGHMTILPRGTTLAPIQKRAEETLTRAGWNDAQRRVVATDDAFSDLFTVANINPYLHLGMIQPNGKRENFTYVQLQTSENVEAQLLRKIVSDVVYGEQESTYWHWRDITSGFSSRERVNQLKSTVHRFRSVINL